MATSTASPWESPWLLMLLLSCAGKSIPEKKRKKRKKKKD